MKQILMILAAILAIGNMTAKAQMRSGVDTLKLDQVNYRITYEAKQVNDTTQTPYIYRQALMRLDIGKNISHFYNLSQLQWSEQVTQMILSGSVIDLQKAEPVKCMNWQFLKNYPEKRKTMFQETFAMSTYQCIEDIEIPDWQLIPDSSTNILNYPCQLAKAHFKGRIWYAWYSEDIPISEGPWKLYGLPGLVLRAYDAQHQFYLNANGMEDLKGEIALTYEKKEKKAEIVSQADLTKIKQRGGDLADMYRGIKATDENGNPIKMKPKKHVFNPIER